MEHQVVEIHEAEKKENSIPSHKTHESTSSHYSVASPNPAKPALGSKNVHLIDAGLMQEVDRVAKAGGEGQQQDQASIKTEAAKAEEGQPQDQTSIRPEAAEEGQQQDQTSIKPEAAKAEEGQQQHQAYIRPEAAIPEEGEQSQAYIRPDAGKAKETQQQSQAYISSGNAKAKERQQQDQAYIRPKAAKAKEGQQQDQASIRSEAAKAEEGQQQHQAYIRPEAAKPEEGQQHQAYIRPEDAKPEKGKQSQAYIRQKDLLGYAYHNIVRRLKERPPSLRGGKTSSICVFKFPNSLLGIGDNLQVPEIVSIGPYHRGKEHLLKFEEHKWSFLKKVLSRKSGSTGQALSYYLEEMIGIEAGTRECYAEAVVMSSPDFVEMMLLDSLFVIELFFHLWSKEVEVNDNDDIFSSPWLIPILIRDLLKLENQLPLFFLRKMFYMSRTSGDRSDKNFDFLAFSVFELAFPRTDNVMSFLSDGRIKGAKHLLDLFYLSLLPHVSQELDYHPSSHSLQAVTRLRSSGIKFKSLKSSDQESSSSDTHSFLDVKFHNRVLQIPKITMNDFFGSLLLNCVAWEQCQENRLNYFNDYVFFMSCLINEPRDVAFLCADGVFAAHSKDDQFVANLFNTLGKNVVFNNRKSYLSKQVTEIEAYYSSNWAYIKRTYFSSPWSLISVAYALLLLLFTILQLLVAILSYIQQIRQPAPK